MSGLKHIETDSATRKEKNDTHRKKKKVKKWHTETKTKRETQILISLLKICIIKNYLICNALIQLPQKEKNFN